MNYVIESGINITEVVTFNFVETRIRIKYN